MTSMKVLFSFLISVLCVVGGKVTFAEDPKPFVFPKPPPSPPPISHPAGATPASVASGVTITTLSGEKYEHAVVTGSNPEFIDVTHAAGVARVYFTNLDAGQQKRFGFDPAKLIAYRAAQEAQRKSDEEAAAKARRLARDKEARLAPIRARKLAALRQWASDNLLLASREDQLRAALAAKYFQQRGNRRLSAAEFQFLDDQSKCSIILYSPEMLPPELLDP